MRRCIALFLVLVFVGACGPPPSTKQRLPLTSNGCDNLLPSVAKHASAPPGAITALQEDGLASARCTIQVIVGVDGRVTSAVVTRSTGYHLLDEAALEAATGTVFRPAVENGEVVACQTELTYTFGTDR